MRAATFTTYINAQTDPGIEQAFARQTRIATSSYATIQRSAEAATRATAGLTGGRVTQTAPVRTISSTNANVSATRAATQAAAEQERQIARTSNATRRHVVDTDRAARAHSNLTRTLNTTSTSLAVVQGRMGVVAGRMVTVARAAEQLTSVQLGIAGIGAAAFALGTLANNYAVLESRVAPFYKTQQQTTAAMRDIEGIAKRTRSALTPIVDVYTRLITVGEQFGISQQRLSRLAETSSRAVTIGGGSTQAKEAALAQFGQALSSNFQSAGQELNSLRDQAPVLLNAILKGYKDADGTIGVSISRFKALAEQGKVSTLQVLEAVERSGRMIDEMGKRIPATLGTASTALSNEATIMIGRLDKAVGLTGGLASGILTVATNLRAVTALAVGAAAAFAAIKLAPMIGAARDRVSTRILTLQREAAIERGNAIAREYYAKEEAQQTARQVVNSRASLTALAAEEAAIQKQIVALRAKQVAAQQTVTAARASQFGRARGPGDPVAGISTGAAEVKAQAATRALSQAEAQARGIRAALTAETNNLIRANVANTVATSNYARVLATTTPRFGALRAAITGVRSAAGSLVSFLGGPWGVAFAAATAAMYLFATAESAAEAATRKNEEAQRSFAGTIDRSTGKIYDQVGALELLAQKKLQADALVATNTQAKTNQNAIVNQLRPFVGGGAPRNGAGMGPGVGIGAPARSPEQQELKRFVDAFERNEAGSLDRLQEAIARLTPKIAGLGRVAPGVGTQIGEFRTNLRGGTNAKGEVVIGARQAAARLRVVSGQARPGDEQLALGETPTRASGAPTKARSAAQRRAEAQERSARTDIERARADLAQIRANGPQQGESEDAYIDREAAAIRSIRDLVKAEKDARAARSAGAKEERQQARDALTDRKDAIEQKRDEALLDLQKRKPTLGQDEFLQARIAILKTYDDEMNAADASASATSSAVRQQIADTKALQAAAERSGEKRRDILAQYSEEPRSFERANDQVEDLQRLVDTAVDGAALIGKTKAEIEEIKKINPLGTGIYTQEMADADAARIQEGVRKPLRDIARDHQRNLEIMSLQLQGREAEAEALRRTNALIDQFGEKAANQYNTQLRMVREEERMNELLADRERIVGRVQDQVQGFRSQLEGLLTDLPVNPRDAGRKFANDFFASVRSASARSLTDRLLAGTDSKIKELLTGKVDAEGALRKYVRTIESTGTETANLASAMERAAKRIDDASGRFTAAGEAAVQGASGSGSGLVDESNINNPIANGGAGYGLASVLAVLRLTGKSGGGPISGANDDGQITVTGQIPKDRTVVTGSRSLNALQTIGKYDVAQTQGGQIGKNIADALGVKDGSFFTKIGSKFGQAFQGAGEGAIASGMVKALGIKQDGTGAQIGGAIGSFLPIPGGALIGGIIGGTLGGLIKGPTRSGYASLTTDQFGNASTSVIAGKNSEGRKKDALGYAGGVLDSLDQIASALGGRLAGGLNFGSIGSQNDQFVYDPDGNGRASGIKFKTLEEATMAAIEGALTKGAITGISQASKNILASGQELSTAIEKAVAIESIPKRLMQRQDPARFAVSELNREFETLISYLKEGGATAAQFADAEKLYELERAEAIEKATEQVSNALDQFLRDMISSSASPFNKRTTYNNAAADLDKFKADIAGGKAVDQNDLISAARNFQDASRTLNGSSESFFQDFEMLRSLLTKARDNAGVTGVTDLPASPFAKDGAVQASIDQLSDKSVAATNNQTTVLGSKLDQLIEAFRVGGVSANGTPGYSGSTIKLLPGFRAA